MKLIIALLLMLAAYGLTAQGNCWNKYTTEYQAILNCERK